MLLSIRWAAWVTALVLALPTSDSQADVDAGIAAYRRGDFVLAYAEFRAAAQQNDPLALNVLGIMHADGTGVERNDKAAVDWFFKAQTLGSLEAGANLGRMYADGRGVPQNNAEALKQYRGAALGGYLPAMKRLAEIFERGELGVTPDPAVALEWRARLKGTPTGLMHVRPPPAEPLAPPAPPRSSNQPPPSSRASAPKASIAAVRTSPARTDADREFEMRVMRQLEKYRQRERKLQVASTDAAPELRYYLHNLRSRLRIHLQGAFPTSRAPTEMTVSLSILRDGTIKDIEFDRGSGNPKLDRKVLLALKQLGNFTALPPAVQTTTDMLVVTVRLPVE
ncbi:MAG: TonB C-terminal domain-containing protein [Sterolibacterium sp.]